MLDLVEADPLLVERLRIATNLTTHGRPLSGGDVLQAPRLAALYPGSCSDVKPESGAKQFHGTVSHVSSESGAPGFSSTEDGADGSETATDDEVTRSWSASGVRAPGNCRGHRLPVSSAHSGRGSVAEDPSRVLEEKPRE